NGEASESKSNKKKDSFFSKRKNWLKQRLAKRKRAERQNAPEQVSYEQMLMRYGDWKNVRWQLMAYLGLVFAANLHKAHGDFLKMAFELETITVGRHVACCCDMNPVLQYGDHLGHIYGAYNPLSVWVLLCGLAFSFTCVLWERYLGRRKAMLIACIVGIIVSVCSCFEASPEVITVMSMVFGLVRMVIDVCTVSTLTEMLPYNL
ncbi:hypothetical protein PMAYCL1PPCAC_05331, partial [Pristionchus mayeri]